MYKGEKIALVIPAHNEERLIGATLERVPETIDRIYVVDDASLDQTGDIVRKYAEIDQRVELIRHEKNKGVGAAIITGYLQASADDYDISVVVGGDNQMPLEVVEDFLEPIVNGEIDYTKGNRFLMPAVGLEGMPWTRFIGNAILSIMTKMASGYYKIYDVVDGYTAITKRAIDLIDWGKAWEGYGYPMDFLVRLNAMGLKVKDVPRRAIYLEGEVAALPVDDRMPPDDEMFIIDTGKELIPENLDLEPVPFFRVEAEGALPLYARQVRNG